MDELVLVEDRLHALRISLLALKVAAGDLGMTGLSDRLAMLSEQAADARDIIHKHRTGAA